MQKTIPRGDGFKPDPQQMYYDARQFLLLPDDGAFLHSAYACILKRSPDEEGYHNYYNSLKKGVLRQQVLTDLLMSEEASGHAVTVTHLRTFMAWANLERTSPFARRLFSRPVWLLQRILNRVQLDQALQLRAQFALEIETKKSIYKTSQEIKEIANRVEIIEEQIAALRSQLHLLKNQDANRMLSQEPPKATIRTSTPAQKEDQQRRWQEDFSNFYLEFEIAFRGSREAIRARLEHYLTFLPPTRENANRVVDLGCGRGEWLSLLEEHGYAAQGLDSSPVMLQICREQGLDVSGQPMHLWLQSQSGGSIAAITAFHLAEHLPFEYLLALVKEAKRLLQPGGVLIIETQNPESLRVSAYAFYHDPTHRNPLTPELLEFMARYTGFQPVELQKLSEVPEDFHIRETTETAVQFNQLLNAPRDLALIAYQPKDVRKAATPS